MNPLISRFSAPYPQGFRRPPHYLGPPIHRPPVNYFGPPHPPPPHGIFSPPILQPPHPGQGLGIPALQPPHPGGYGIPALPALAGLYDPNQNLTWGY